MPSDDNYRAALTRGYLPIREVARATGVNAITLRAWERRYGLIVPYRTPKGHRLYSPANVERIHTILTWLNRGVAVSQVRGLVEGKQEVTPSPRDDWSLLRAELVTCIEQLAERRLDERFNCAMALYPPHTLVEHLLWPLLNDLQQRWRSEFAAGLEQAFFHSWLRGKFAARLYHNNRQANGAPVLLVGLDESIMEPGLWLCSWLISDSDCPVQLLDQPLSPAELQLALERITPRALVLYAGQSLDSSQLQRQLPKLVAGSSLPLLLAGPASAIHRDELGELTLAADPLAAHAWLRSQGLLDVHKDSPCSN